METVRIGELNVDVGRPISKIAARTRIRGTRYSIEIGENVVLAYGIQRSNPEGCLVKMRNMRR